MSRFSVALVTVSRCSACTAGVLLGTLTTISAASAAVSPEVVSLSWTAPQECPQLAQVTRQVFDLVEHPLSLPLGLDAQGTILRGRSGNYTLFLETTEGEHRGVRSFSGTSCAELTAAAAAVLALTIAQRAESIERAEREAREARFAVLDPFLAPFPEEPAPEDPEPNSASSDPLPEEPALTRAKRFKRFKRVGSAASRSIAARDSGGARRADDHSSGAWLGVGLIADAGTMPGLSPGVSVSLSAHHQMALVSVSGTWLPAQHKVVEMNGSESADYVTYVSADVQGCIGPWAQALVGGMCLGLGVGSLQGEKSYGTYSNPELEVGTTVVSLRLGALVRHRLTHDVSLQFGAYLLALRTERSTFDPAEGAVRVDVGFGHRF